MSGSEYVKTYKLSEATRVGDQLVQEIKFKRPKGKHIKGLNIMNLTSDDMFTIAGKISDQPSVVFEEIPLRDWLKIQEQIADFLDAGPQTGRS